MSLHKDDSESTAKNAIRIVLDLPNEGSDSLRERCITNLKLYEVKNGVKEPDKDAFKNLIDYLDRSTPINSSTLLNKPPKPPTPDYGDTDM